MILNIKQILLTISWKFMEIITFFISLYNDKMVPFFHSITNNYFKNEVLVINEGKEIMKFKTIPLFQNHLNCCDEKLKYELLLYTVFDKNENDKKNYSLISNHSLNEETIKQRIKKKSNVNFIMFELQFQNKKYDIMLKSPKNFLIENNVFGLAFFKWYLNTYYSITLNENFTISYMTNDMELVTISWPFILKLGENGITSFASSPKKNKITVDRNEEL